MLTVETCSLCAGRKTVRQFQERKHLDDILDVHVWVAETGTDGLPPYAVEELRATVLRKMPWAFRWADVECPRCQGVGEYVVEHFACKIF